MHETTHTHTHMHMHEDAACIVSCIDRYYTCYWNMYCTIMIRRALFPLKAWMIQHMVFSQRTAIYSYQEQTQHIREHVLFSCTNFYMHNRFAYRKSGWSKTVSGDDMSYYRTIEMRLKAKCGSRKFCFDVKTSGSLNAKKTSSTRARKHNVARKKQYTRPTKTWTTALYSI